MTKTFALIGCAGYIAPRHMKAIKETGNEIVAALDKHDSVGILDSYFPEADFFTEVERFDRHLEKLRRQGKGVDYVSVCTPNYLHDAHIRLGLRVGAHVICEKPLVINPWNITPLEELEQETGRKINTVLQLRHHPSLISLREKISLEIGSTPSKRFQVSLRYITPRGRWYDYSWKGDESKSGGIATNLGIHFFDMLIWMFGKPISHSVTLSTPRKMSGTLQLAHADVSWFLSCDKHDLPEENKVDNTPYRSITVDREEVEFSNVFRDLHTTTYQHILEGRGFGVRDALASVQLVHDLRKQASVI